MTTVHIPILVEPIVEALLEPFQNLDSSAPAHWIVDCTLGGGGHTQAFLDALAREPKLSRHRILSIDQDESAVERAKQRFQQEITTGRLEVIHMKMGSLASELKSRPVLGLMADLGFSS